MIDPEILKSCMDETLFKRPTIDHFVTSEYEDLKEKVRVEQSTYQRFLDIPQTEDLTITVNARSYSSSYDEESPANALQAGKQLITNISYINRQDESTLSNEDNAPCLIISQGPTSKSVLQSPVVLFARIGEANVVTLQFQRMEMVDLHNSGIYELYDVVAEDKFFNRDQEKMLRIRGPLTPTVDGYVDYSSQEKSFAFDDNGNVWSPQYGDSGLIRLEISPSEREMALALYKKMFNAAYKMIDDGLAHIKNSKSQN